DDVLNVARRVGGYLASPHILDVVKKPNCSVVVRLNRRVIFVAPGEVRRIRHVEHKLWRTQSFRAAVRASAVPLIFDLKNWITSSFVPGWFFAGHYDSWS